MGKQFDALRLRCVRRALVFCGLLGVGLLAGCDMGHNGMMGNQAVPTHFESNGERIYFTGTSVSDRPITFTTGWSTHMLMHGGGCVNCHGADREGGARMMPWFWIEAPAITPHALFEAHGEGEGHGEHAAYAEATLRRAISQGIDPSGEPLDDTMPRWSMSEQDLDDLIDYLRGAEGHAD